MSEITNLTTTAAKANQQPASTKRKSLIERMADQLDVDSAKLWGTLKTSCFKPDKDGNQFTDSEVMYVLLLAEQLELNPLRREIWAFRGKGGDVQPIVSIDGWKAIMLRQPTFNGYEIRYSDSSIELPEAGRVPEWAECTIWLKGIDHPTTERVYMAEAFVGSSPVWKKSPRRMLHHRALIQAIRFSFPISGISDVGVAEDGSVIDGEATYAGNASASSGVRYVGQTKPTKLVAIDNNKLEEIAVKAIQMARSRNDYGPAFRFAQQVDASAREYVMKRLQEAQDEDLRKAMSMHEEVETIETVQPVSGPAESRLDAFA